MYTPLLRETNKCISNITPSRCRRYPDTWKVIWDILRNISVACVLLQIQLVCERGTAAWYIIENISLRNWIFVKNSTVKIMFNTKILSNIDGYCTLAGRKYIYRLKNFTTPTSYDIYKIWLFCNFIITTLCT